MESMGSSFAYIAHSMMIIGWGYDKETDQRYWIVRNSYGPRGGDIKIFRGINYGGIEADAITFEPALCSEESKNGECIVI